MKASTPWQVPAVLATLLLLLAGCASYGPGPDYSDRTQRGYWCDSDVDCTNDYRCYKRFPNSIGRCVYQEYFDEHARGCATDRDCAAAEICIEPTDDQFGTCNPRFRATQDPEPPKRAGLEWGTGRLLEPNNAE